MVAWTTLHGHWWILETEEGHKRVEAAHVRDIKYGAGIATKPEYFAVPLHPKIHKDQHDKGIYHLWKKAGRPTPSSVTYPIQDKEDHIRQWLIQEALSYIRLWIKYELTEYFDVSSLSFVSEEMFSQFVNDKCSDQETINKLIELIQER